MSRFQDIKLVNGKIERGAIAELVAPSDPKKNRALMAILRHVEEELPLKSAILETGYIDEDYQSMLAVWYSKGFKKYSQYCCRLHFFCDLVDVNQLADGKVDPAGYLGYSILTPLVVGRVGRTVLSPWEGPVLVGDNPSFPLFLKAPSRVHLFGLAYEVEGFSFISQDSMIMVCAHTAIWMAVNYLHARYGDHGIKRYLPSEIAAAAHDRPRESDRSLPSEGLSIYQIVRALANFDFRPVLATVDDPAPPTMLWQPINWITKYIDSEIPVILGTRNPAHAIVAVGALHSQFPDYKLLHPGKCVTTLDPWIPGIIVNDDVIGPYRVMPVNNEMVSWFLGQRKELLPPERHWQSATNVDSIMVPLPKEVSLQARQIDPIVEDILDWDRVNRVLYPFSRLKVANQYLEYTLSVLQGNEPSDRVVTRAFLIHSMDFLVQIRHKYPADLQAFYNASQYPNYVWIIELMLQTEIVKQHPLNRRIVGEIILDSTASGYGSSWLHIHMNGTILSRDVSNDNLEVRVLGEYSDYPSTKCKGGT